MATNVLFGTLLCGILLGGVTANTACSSMGGCPQDSNDQSVLLQSHVLLRTDQVTDSEAAEQEEDGESAADAANIAGEDDGEAMAGSASLLTKASDVYHEDFMNEDLLEEEIDSDEAEEVPALLAVTHTGNDDLTSAYANLLKSLAQCDCPLDSPNSPPYLSARATEMRGRQYPPTKQFLEAVQHLQLPLFLRAGTLLATIRNQGWMPYDYDFDVALAADSEDQADEYVQKLKSYLERQDSGFSVTHHAGKEDFVVEHANQAGGWPIADGVIFFRREAEENSGETSWNERKSSFQASNLVNLPRRFLPSEFGNMTWEPFYDTVAPAPPNFREFLDGIYGENWRCEAVNKCNEPNGMLFKEDPKHCKYSLYAGAADYPVHTCGPSMQRGQLAIN